MSSRASENESRNPTVAQASNHATTNVLDGVSTFEQLQQALQSVRQRSRSRLPTAAPMIVRGVQPQRWVAIDVRAATVAEARDQLSIAFGVYGTVGHVEPGGIVRVWAVFDQPVTLDEARAVVADEEACATVPAGSTELRVTGQLEVNGAGVWPIEGFRAKLDEAAKATATVLGSSVTTLNEASRMRRALGDMCKALKLARFEPEQTENFVYAFARDFVPAYISVEAFKAELDAARRAPGAAPHNTAGFDNAVANGLARAETNPKPAVLVNSPLHRSKFGEVTKCQANVTVLVQHMLWRNNFVEYDTRAGVIRITQDPPWSADAFDQRVTPREIDDADCTQIGLHFKNVYSYPYAENSQIARALGAMRSTEVLQTVDPVSRYIDNCKAAWRGSLDEGRALLSTALIRHAEAADTRLTRAVTLRWFLIAAKRALEPGCIYRQVLVLIGPQWGGKSSFVRELSPQFEWVLEGIDMHGDSKETARKLRSKWLVEIGEIDQHIKEDRTGGVKDFVSRVSDYTRDNYENRYYDVPRGCVFIGTTNVERPFRDPTGNTRFDPVRVGRVDHEAVAAERDQLWGAAATLLEAGEQPFLTDDERELAGVQQLEHYATPAEHELLEDLLTGPVPMVPPAMANRDDADKSLTLEQRRWLNMPTWHHQQVKLGADGVRRIVLVGTKQLLDYLAAHSVRVHSTKISAVMLALGWAECRLPNALRRHAGQRGWCHPSHTLA